MRPLAIGLADEGVGLTVDFPESSRSKAEEVARVVATKDLAGVILTGCEYTLPPTWSCPLTFGLLLPGLR